MQSKIGDGGRGALEGWQPEIAGVDPHVEGEDNSSTRAKGIAAADEGNGDRQTETPVSNPWPLRCLMAYAPAGARLDQRRRSTRAGGEPPASQVAALDDKHRRGRRYPQRAQHTGCRWIGRDNDADF